MLPGSGAGPTTGHTGVGFPSSARAPADVAPSATVFGFGRVCDADAAFALGGALDFALLAAGLATTLPLSCATMVTDAESDVTTNNNAEMRREFERDVNTIRD